MCFTRISTNIEINTNFQKNIKWKNKDKPFNIEVLLLRVDPKDMKNNDFPAYRYIRYGGLVIARTVQGNITWTSHI